MTRHLATCAIVALGAAALLGTPATAGWKRMESQVHDVGKGAMAVRPATEWNRWSRREARNGETWTKDGFQLNRLDFSGNIGVGEPIFKERRKKEMPLPKFSADMLPTDLADLYESTFRITQGVTEFNVRTLEPSTLGGQAGIRLVFDYALPNDALTRLGEARLAVKDGELFVVSFIAPELHYFDASIEEVRAIMEGLRIE